MNPSQIISGDRAFWRVNTALFKFDPIGMLSSEEAARRYFDGDKSCFPREILRNRGNLLLDAGITAMLQLITATGSPTAFSNANAYIGIGDGNPSNLTGTTGWTNGSATVTGSGTTFTSEVAVGDTLIGPDTVFYKVLSIASDTSLTLTANFTGTTASGLTTVLLPGEAATQTNLQAPTNKYYGAMDASYPTVAGQTMTFQTTVGSGNAEYAWREWVISSGNTGVVAMNRKVSDQGTKGPSSTWTFQVAITLG